MKVLVTGASGFVGQALLSVMRQRGYDYIAAVRRPSGLQNETVITDLDGDSAWRAAMVGCDAIVHLKARPHVMNDAAPDPLQAYRAVNVEATLSLARQAVDTGIKRFVFVSSIKVNGEATAPGNPFHADSPPAPEDAYGLSKYEAEQGLMALARGSDMEVVIIRPPLVYGPGVKGNFASMVRLVRKGVPLPLGAIDNRRSLIAIDNLVDFIALCADRQRSPQAANEIFLVSDGEDVSTTGLLRKIAAAYGLNAKLLPVPVGWLRMAAAMVGKRAVIDRLAGSLVVDSTRSRELLGWTQVTSMDEQLRKMALHDTRV